MSGGYTKGEWMAVGCWVEHVSDDVADIASCNTEDIGQAHMGRSYAEMAANALLMAAAPRMLKALRRVLRSGSLNDEDREFVRSAIFNATGRLR